MNFSSYKIEFLRHMFWLLAQHIKLITPNEEKGERRQENWKFEWNKTFIVVGLHDSLNLVCCDELTKFVVLLVNDSEKNVWNSRSFTFGWLAKFNSQQEQIYVVSSKEF